MSTIKIAFCIPTFEQKDRIFEFLEQFMSGYEERGIDVYIYDSSIDDETEIIVKNYQHQTDNLYYIRVSNELTSIDKMYKIFQQFGLKKEYDFIWACGDGIRYSLEAIDIILPQISIEYDVIHINSMDEEGIGNREYKDCNEYFMDCAWHTTLFGALILNYHTMLKDVCWEKYEAKFLNDVFLSFAHVCFYFNRFLELQQFHSKHISGYYCYTTKLKKQCGWYKNTFKVLGERWVKSIESLPDCYTNKDEVLRKFGRYAALENESAFLQKRIDGVYDENIYAQYEKVLPRICDIPIKRMKEIAFMTKEQAGLEMQKWVDERRKNGLAELNSFIEKYPKFLIYGAGLNAKRYAKLFQKENVVYEGFCISERKTCDNELMGHPCYAAEEIGDKLKEYGIYLALNIVNRKQVREFLEKKGILDQLFFSEELDTYVHAFSKNEEI